MKPLEIGDQLVCVDFAKRTRDPAKYLKPGMVYTIQGFSPYYGDPIINDGITGPQSEMGRAWHKNRFALVEKVGGPIYVGDQIVGRTYEGNNLITATVEQLTCTYGCCYLTRNATPFRNIIKNGAQRVKLTPIKPADGFAAGLTAQAQAGIQVMGDYVEKMPLDPKKGEVPPEIVIAPKIITKPDRPKSKKAAKPKVGLYTAEPTPSKKAAVNARTFALQSLELAEEQYLRSCGWTKRRNGNWTPPADHPKANKVPKEGYVTAHALNSTRFWLGKGGREIGANR